MQSERLQLRGDAAKKAPLPPEGGAEKKVPVRKFRHNSFALWIPLFFVAFFPGNLMAESLSSRDISGLQKVEMAQHVLYETCMATANGPAGVLGYYFDRYFSKNGYVSLAILGALSGRRGGYGFAAVGLGHRWKLAPALTFQ